MNAADMVAQLNTFETPDAIAAMLREAGIKGDTEDSESCVISNWFMSNLDCIGVNTNDMIQVFYDDWQAEGPAVYEMSICLKQFVDLFDRGFYPDLVIEYDEEPWCSCPACNSEYY